MTSTADAFVNIARLESK